jgi:MarR-like DNA-binding transcriptional regulator SgrR of sgrS sRNA
VACSLLLAKPADVLLVAAQLDSLLGQPTPSYHRAAAQVWEQAEQAGLKSKRFTKMMLHQLREAGWVKTQPLGGSGKKGHKNFGYRLNLAKQQQYQAKAARHQLEVQAAAA